VAQKKKWSTLSIVMAVFAVLGMLVVLVAIGAIVTLARTDTAKKGFALLGEVQEAQKAPGMRELRKIGCETAMVMETEKLLAITAIDGGASPEDASEDVCRLIVTCQGGLFRTVPTCDQVAGTYVDAVHEASGTFCVMVSSSKDPKPGCQERYSATGASLGSLGTPKTHGGSAKPSRSRP
jgi:hypothetical protein